MELRNRQEFDGTVHTTCAEPNMPVSADVVEFDLESVFTEYEQYEIENENGWLTTSLRSMYAI